MNLREVAFVVKGTPITAVAARAQEAEKACGPLTKEQEAIIRDWTARQLQFKMSGQSRKKW